MNQSIEYPGDISNFIFNSIIRAGHFSSYLWSTFAIFFVLILFYLTFYRKENNTAKRSLFSIDSSFFFLAIVLSGIIVLRLPAICATELNTDESQWLSSAATLMKDFRFWHSVNGMTSGPLVIYPVCLIKLLGFSLNYANLRLFAIMLCIFPVIILLFKTLQFIFNIKVAKIITLPLFLFIAITEHFDILAYNGEHIPMLLFSLAFFVFVKTQYSNKCGRLKMLYYSLLCGFLIGIMPFSKLQSSPIAFSFFTGVCLINIISKEKSLFKNTAFIAGMILPGILIYSYLLIFNLTTEFWNYYIINNFEYSNQGLYSSSPTWLLIQKNEAVMHWHQKIFIVPRLILLSKDTALFFGSMVLFASFGLLFLKNKFSVTPLKHKLTIAFIAFNLLFGYFAVIKPGNIFLHYILLLVVPSTLFAGFLLGILLKNSPENSEKMYKYLRFYAVITVILPVILFSLDGNCYIREYISNNPRNRISRVGSVLTMYSKPGDRMAVWGYLNSIYTEAELLQAAREPNSYLQITESPLRDYFTQKYCRDIIENNPVVFVDAVGRSSFFYYDYFQRHENFPAVFELINSKYELKETVDDVRIYTRKNSN